MLASEDLHCEGDVQAEVLPNLVEQVLICYIKLADEFVRLASLSIGVRRRVYEEVAGWVGVDVDKKFGVSELSAYVLVRMPHEFRIL